MSSMTLMKEVLWLMCVPPGKIYTINCDNEIETIFYICFLWRYIIDLQEVEHEKGRNDWF